MKFESAAQVRSFLKGNGFTGVSVRWGNNPFGGDGKWVVKLTNIPKGTTVIYSGGSNESSREYSDNTTVAERFANLRLLLRDTNCIVG